MSGSNLLWLSIGVGLTLAIGWGGLRFYRWYGQRRFGDSAVIDQQLSRYYHQMAADINDRAAMAQLLTVEIAQALGVDRAELLLLADHELIGAGELRLAVNNVAVRQVAASGSALRVNGELRRLIEQNRLDLRWTGVWVPLMRNASLHGMWLLGQRSTGQQFTADQLQALTTLARQAALILETVKIAQREQESARQLQALYQQSVSASEVERSRLSRELHDGVLQDLCAITRDLKVLEHRGEPSNSPIEPLILAAGEAVNTLRTICNTLRPPLLTSNLALALQALVERLRPHSTAMLSFKSAAESLNLSEETTIAIYRIAQEAITNALQHADASEIQVRLTQYPDALRLTISDDGCGLPDAASIQRAVEAGHFGLASMRERARMIGARLEIQSAQEYGTAVILIYASDQIDLR